MALIIRVSPSVPRYGNGIPDMLQTAVLEHRYMKDTFVIEQYNEDEFNKVCEFLLGRGHVFYATLDEQVISKPGLLTRRAFNNAYLNILGSHALELVSQIKENISILERLGRNERAREIDTLTLALVKEMNSFLDGTSETTLKNYTIVIQKLQQLYRKSQE